MHHIPLFYNDEHAERLLKLHDRFFNVHYYEPTGAHLIGSAFGTRKDADRFIVHRSARAAYRIVVRMKRRGACIDDELQPYDMYRIRP